MRRLAMKICTRVYLNWVGSEGRFTRKDKVLLAFARLLCFGKDPIMIWAGELD